MPYITGNRDTFESRLHQLATTSGVLDSFITEGNSYWNTITTGQSIKWEREARISKYRFNQGITDLTIPLFNQIAAPPATSFTWGSSAEVPNIVFSVASVSADKLTVNYDSAGAGGGDPVRLVFLPSLTIGKTWSFSVNLNVSQGVIAWELVYRDVNGVDLIGPIMTTAVLGVGTTVITSDSSAGAVPANGCYLVLETVTPSPDIYAGNAVITASNIS